MKFKKFTNSIQNKILKLLKLVSKLKINDYLTNGQANKEIDEWLKSI